MPSPDARPTPSDITALVNDFYARVRVDPLLAPVFESRIGHRWPDHLERMVAFWSSVLLGKAGFVGDPVGKHRAIAELEPRHFDRWMELFGEVLAERFTPERAADILGRAARIRVALERRPDESRPPSLPAGAYKHA